MSPGVSQHRVSYSLEEALRLARLPGEEEGRIYCFRRVSLTGIQAKATRSIWMGHVQQTLTALSRKSIHGSIPNASAADAIYFNSLEEALEMLLHRALDDAAIFSPPEWFATSILGIASQANYSTLIPVILDRLRSSLTPGAAASILILALGDRDAASLVSSIPEDAFRTWLRAFDDANTAVHAPTVQLPDPTATMLQRAASQFGWRSPGLLWLATQAVLSVSPGAWGHGVAVKKARAILRLLESESRNTRRESNHLPQSAPTRIWGFEVETEIDSRPVSSSEGNVNAESAKEQPLVSSDQSFAPPARPSFRENPFSISTSVRNTNLLACRPAPLGEITHAGGLLFLLNVLRHLGIASALHDHPALAEASLPAHILRRLALELAVAENDPVLLCLRSAEGPLTLSPEALNKTLPLPTARPLGFAPPTLAVYSSQYFLRSWALAAKIWCWRHARLTVRQIILRNGRLFQTRTDVDVTFALDQADVRIRRVGLDIDPGWLPWFGDDGKIVRFHYRYREPEENAC